ncbi:hypothetical protein WJX72_001753 [[Myrmecia] bisecta]|uniref:Ionotropic glutamate receptor C-terminal domain-containing protein n=1 Tax=[Myrmecia] bisecta TaxID=41462 RepID=A0AAW1P9I2_9CHLO
MSKQWDFRLQPFMKTCPWTVLSTIFACTAATNALRNGNGTDAAPLNVCISDWRPMVACDGLSSPDAFTGYQPQLFRQVVANMGMKPSTYNFTCMNWDDMIADLLDPDGSCDLSAAGVEVSVQNLELGLKFSVPTYKTGLSILVAAQYVTGGTFAFMNAFDKSVWIAIGVTGVSIAMILWLLERLNKLQDPEMREFDCTTFDEMMWRNIGTLVTHEEYYVSGATRIIEFAYAFLIVVMVSLYTANTTVQVTAVHFKGSIQSIADLPGKVVGTWTNYMDILKKYNIKAIGLPWDNDADQQALFDTLRSGEIHALILDSPVLEYTQSQQCDIHVVGQEFNTFNLALAFPPNTPVATIVRFSFSLVELQQDGGLMDDLQSKYINNPYSPCNVGGGGGDTLPLQFSQVAGLWYILAASVGAACLYMLVFFVLDKLDQRWRLVRGMGKRIHELLPENLVRAHSELIEAGRTPSLSRARPIQQIKLRKPSEKRRKIYPAGYNDGKPTTAVVHQATKVAFKESGGSEDAWSVEAGPDLATRLLAIRDMSQRLLAAVNAELQSVDHGSPGEDLY